MGALLYIKRPPSSQKPFARPTRPALRAGLYKITFLRVSLFSVLCSLISTGSNERERIRIVRVGRHRRSDGGFDEQAEESVLGGAGDRPDGLRRGGEATDGVRSSGAGTVPGCRGDGSSAHGSGGGAS